MATIFDATGKSRADFVQEIKNEFETGIRAVYESERWRDWLEFNSRFHSYSARNRFLIYLQNPEATRVASMSKWNEVGRYVIKGQGAKGLKVWAPTTFKQQEVQQKVDDDGKPVLDKDGNPVLEEVMVKKEGFIPVSVYDISQTQGEPLPTLIDELKGANINKNVILKSLEKISGVPIEFEDISGGVKGCYEEKQSVLEPDAPIERRIVIKIGMSDEQTIKTAIHETTHAMLHNFERKKEGKKKTEKKSKREKEVEAESVAYIVSRHIGIDTSDYTFGYLAAWSSDKSLPELTESMDVIIQTADTICRDMTLYVRGLNLDKCVNQEAVKAYMENSPYLTSISGKEIFSVYSARLAEADKLASEGFFVEVYKSERPEFSVGKLYSLSQVDSLCVVANEKANEEKKGKGFPRSFDKVYFTVHYRDKSGSYHSITQRMNFATPRSKTFTQTLQESKEHASIVHGRTEQTHSKKHVR